MPSCLSRLRELVALGPLWVFRLVLHLSLKARDQCYELWCYSRGLADCSGTKGVSTPFLDIVFQNIFEFENPYLRTKKLDTPMEWTPRFFGGSLHSLRGGSWGGEAGEPILGPGFFPHRRVRKSRTSIADYFNMGQSSSQFLKIRNIQRPSGKNPLDHGHHPVPPTGWALNTAAIMGCRRL